MLHEILFRDIVNDIATKYSSENQNYPWIVGYSGGKDSTLVCHLVLSSLLQIPPKNRTRKIYIITNDTLVESPLICAHIDKTLDLIDNTSNVLNLPVHTVKTKPNPKETFWVLLIGKGYPTPNTHMRWCTDRLKIKPTSIFIKSHISKEGAAIIVLGVRKDESNSRRMTIEKYEKMQNKNLSPHPSLNGAFVYSPISSLTTGTVWDFLAYEDPPWGGTHEELIQLYKDADAGECPMMVTKKESGSCSRFGCWVCTLVKNDKSLESFAKATRDKQLHELIDFRNWLLSIRNNPDYRQIRRRNGIITFDKNDNHIPGPFTHKARKMILDKLLETQKKYTKQLISQEEISEIVNIWAQELSETK